MSDYSKIEADVKDYIKYYYSKKNIYKLDLVAAKLEEKTALDELCEFIGDLSLTKDTCYIRVSGEYSDLIFVYFEGEMIVTRTTATSLFIGKEASTYRDSLEQVLNQAAKKACKNRPDDEKRFLKYIDVIMSNITDDDINKIKELSTRVDDARGEGSKATSKLWELGFEGREMLGRLALTWCDEVEFTKGMTITVVNRNNSKKEDRVIKSVTYPKGEKTIRFEGTSSVITDMQRIDPYRTFILNNEQYLDFAKEVEWANALEE